MLATLAAAGCSGLTHGGPSTDFALLSDAGPILLRADGFAHGFTHSALIEALRKGMVRADRGQVEPFEQTGAAPARSLLLHVEEGFPRPRAQMTMQMFSAGRLVRTVSTAAPTASAFPDVVFVNTIAGLAQQLLPAADFKPGAPGTLNRTW